MISRRRSLASKLPGGTHSRRRSQKKRERGSMDVAFLVEEAKEDQGRTGPKLEKGRKKKEGEAEKE